MFFLGPLVYPRGHFRLSSPEPTGTMGSFPNKAGGARVYLREFTEEVGNMGLSLITAGGFCKDPENSFLLWDLFLSS